MFTWGSLRLRRRVNLVSVGPAHVSLAASDAAASLQTDPSVPTCHDGGLTTTHGVPWLGKASSHRPAKQTAAFCQSCSNIVLSHKKPRFLFAHHRRCSLRQLREPTAVSPQPPRQSSTRVVLVSCATATDGLPRPCTPPPPNGRIDVSLLNSSRLCGQGLHPAWVVPSLPTTRVFPALHVFRTERRAHAHTRAGLEQKSMPGESGPTSATELLKR